jgi:hypothetical protein
VPGYKDSRSVPWTQSGQNAICAATSSGLETRRLQFTGPGCSLSDRDPSKQVSTYPRELSRMQQYAVELGSRFINRRLCKNKGTVALCDASVDKYQWAVGPELHVVEVKEERLDRK